MADTICDEPTRGICGVRVQMHGAGWLRLEEEKKDDEPSVWIMFLPGRVTPAGAGYVSVINLMAATCRGPAVSGYCGGIPGI